MMGSPSEWARGKFCKGKFHYSRFSITWLFCQVNSMLCMILIVFRNRTSSPSDTSTCSITKWRQTWISSSMGKREWIFSNFSWDCCLLCCYERIILLSERYFAHFLSIPLHYWNWSRFLNNFTRFPTSNTAAEASNRKINDYERFPIRFESFSQRIIIEYV